MFTRYTLTAAVECHEPRFWIDPEQTPAEKKRMYFGNMFTLHALLNRAGVDHENKDTLTCSGYKKSKERF